MPDCSVCGVFNSADWEQCPECVWRSITPEQSEQLIFEQVECIYYEYQMNHSSERYDQSEHTSEKKEKKYKEKCCEKHLRKKKMCKRCPEKKNKENKKIVHRK